MGFGPWGDRECVVEHDVVDGVFFCCVFLVVQVVCVLSVVKLSYCSIFVLGGVVGGVWDDRIGNALLNMMWMVFSSAAYSWSCSLYVCSLL